MLFVVCCVVLNVGCLSCVACCVVFVDCGWLCVVCGLMLSVRCLSLCLVPWFGFLVSLFLVCELLAIRP